MEFIENELANIKKELFKTVVNPVSNFNLCEFVCCGSKLIRSVLAIYYLKAQGCEIDEDIVNILVASEIIHNASLLHDDVIDDAEFRRGKTTFSKLYSPKISVILGDYLISLAVKKILEINNTKVLNIFLNCTEEMSKAEIRQFFMRGKLSNVDEYLSVCKGKTASLFIAVLQAVSLLANIDLDKAYEFGQKFGICFQIWNDLDLKSIAEDEKNKVYTAKDILGIEKTNALLDNYKEEMRNLVIDFPQKVYKKRLEDLINSL